MHPAHLGRHRAVGGGEQEAGGPFGTTALLFALTVQSLGEPGDLDTVLAQTLELACELTGAPHAMVSVLGSDGQVARVVSHGEAADGSSMALPLELDGRQVGTFHLTGRPRPFTGADHQLVGVLVGGLTTALGRAHAARDAVAAERIRIAGELDDLVARRLRAAGERLTALLPDLDASAAATVGAVVRSLEGGVGELDAVVHEQQSLSRRVCAAAAEFTDAPVELRLTGSLDRVPEELTAQLLPCLREALANVARHADAGHVDVEVDASDRWLMLRVVDDGVGIRPGAAPGSGLGGLRTRAQHLGGVLRVSPARPRGTRLEWLVPLVPERREARR